ncbi:MAG: sensor histidine kinase [Proteobacteria bacterium]|nr:MAG: sensor histidine kinase [Pseudomonadota bacterium]
MLSFIDDKRQWVKSSVRLKITELKRDESFCTHTIASTEIMIVNDLSLDLCFKNSPYVQSEDGMRFYAGAPILTSTGEALGALCVIDSKPRTLTEDQQQMLTRLARIVVRNLEFRKVAKNIANGVELIQSLTQTIEALRENLISSAKLAMIGRMAAGVHHELQTPNSIIRLHIGRLQEKLKSDLPVDKKYI